MESSQASRTRNKKWLSMENSHSNNSSPATKPMSTSPDRHTDARSKRTVTFRPPLVVGTTTVGGISELDALSASGVDIVITRPRGVPRWCFARLRAVFQIASPRTRQAASSSQREPERNTCEARGEGGMAPNPFDGVGSKGLGLYRRPGCHRRPYRCAHGNQA